MKSTGAARGVAGRAACHTLQSVGACRHRCQRALAVGPGAREPWRVGHDDPAGHLVVDVAADDRHAGLVKDHWCAGHAGIELELERLDRRERVDVVTHRVEVGEVDPGAGGDHGHARDELALPLCDLGVGQGLDGSLGAHRLEKGHGIGQGLAGGIGDRERHRAGDHLRCGDSGTPAGRGQAAGDASWQGFAGRSDGVEAALASAVRASTAHTEGIGPQGAALERARGHGDRLANRGSACNCTLGPGSQGTSSGSLPLLTPAARAGR